jgi:hypothetical protein
VNDKSAWRLTFLEDTLVIAALVAIGMVVAAVKLGPIVMRWAKAV